MPSNLPSSARSALREAVTLVTDMADAMEQEAKRRGIVQSAPTSGPTVVVSLRLLLSLAERGAVSESRLTRLMALVYEGEETCAWLRTMDAMALTITLDAYTNNALASSPTGGTTE